MGLLKAMGSQTSQAIHNRLQFGPIDFVRQGGWQRAVKECLRFSRDQGLRLQQCAVDAFRRVGLTGDQIEREGRPGLRGEADAQEPGSVSVAT